MSTPNTDPKLCKAPTADDLAGTPLSKEEDKPTINVPEFRGNKVRKRGGPEKALPTVDDLAGIPVSVEADEDLTVRPRRRVTQ